MEQFLLAFIPLFVAIDPVGLAAVFLATGRSESPERRRYIARQATLTGGLVSVLFLFLGQTIFTAVGITVGDFQIAGGLILFILAARDLVQPLAEEPVKMADDFGVVPLGMPLIAGPATIATLLVLAKSVGLTVSVLALALNLVFVRLAFAYAHKLGQLLGAVGLRAISKIISLLLAAIAVSMVRHGWTSG